MLQIPNSGANQECCVCRDTPPKQRSHGRTALEITLGELGIKYSRSRPYHPQTCGKVERSTKP